MSIAAGDEEYLEDGTNPATPDGDNLVLDYARAEAAAFGVLVAAGGGRVIDDIDVGVHLCDLGGPSPFSNVALLARPLPEAEEAGVAERIRAFYAAAPGGPYLVISPWRTTDWRPLGYDRVGHPPLMFRPVGPAPAAPAGVEVAPVGVVDVEAFEAAFVEAYPVPELQPLRPGALLGPAIVDTAWRLFVARIGGEVVGTSAAFCTPALNLVELVSVRPEARGRGVGTAVTAAAARAQPDVPSLLIASDAGNAIYRALGYLSLQRCTVWLGLR